MMVFQSFRSKQEIPVIVDAGDSLVAAGKEKADETMNDEFIVSRRE